MFCMYASLFSWIQRCNGVKKCKYCVNRLICEILRYFVYYCHTRSPLQLLSDGLFGQTHLLFTISFWLGIKGKLAHLISLAERFFFSSVHFLSSVFLPSLFLAHLWYFGCLCQFHVPSQRLREIAPCLQVNSSLVSH